MAESEKFHHRTSTFSNKRKAHKIPGKSKASSGSKPFGRVDNSMNNQNNRKFRHCNQFRDIGKLQRKNIAKEKRKNHREKLISNKLKYFAKIKGGIPKIIALISLSNNINLNQIKNNLLKHSNINNNNNQNPIEFKSSSSSSSHNYILYTCNRDDIISLLDICKIADIVLLCSEPSLINNNFNNWNQSILGLDNQSNIICKIIKTYAINSNIYGLYLPHNSNKNKNPKNPKNKNKNPNNKLDPIIQKTYLKYLNHQFNKKNLRIFHSNDMRQIYRFMNNSNYNNFSEWKQKRPHLLALNVDYDNDSKRLIVDGYLRGDVNLNINRPLHITGYGDYLIHKIDGIVDDNHIKNKKDPQNDNIINFLNDIIDDDDNKNNNNNNNLIELIKADKSKQDSLQYLGDLDGLASQFDQTLITEKELQEIENERQQVRKDNKLQKQGLSNYNHQWVNALNADDDNDDDIDPMSDDDDDMKMNVDVDDDNDNLMNDSDNDGNDSDIDDDDINKKLLNTSDEIATPMIGRAKDKLAEYRGLKQFYKTKWNKFELLPIEYARISNIRDWKKAIKMTKLDTLIKNIDDNNNDVIECNGNKIRIYIDNVNNFDVNKHGNKPLILWSILQHENKISVCNFKIQKQSDNNDNNNNKDGSYIFDVGFRRYKSIPIFSCNTLSNKHLVINNNDLFSKNEFMIASIYGYITYPSMPVFMFNVNNNNNNNSFELFGSGSLHNINAHRLLIKRIILTGNVIRVQRRRAVVRYMFWNSDDVNYFKPIDLWTKQGLKGRIEEPIGIKGLMKCFFNGNIKQNDVVCLSLYKRVFPKPDPILFDL